MPNGMLLPIDGHTLLSKRSQTQLEASLPLKKQLWQQTVKAKLRNQARVLMRRNLDAMPLLQWSTQVRSGDPDNMEGRGAAWYWPRWYGQTPMAIDTETGDDAFVRERYGAWPNALLNYGYAVLRAVVARALIGSGLLLPLGIHHRNQYNAYCLADDIMEPYRPSVDTLVWDILQEDPIPDDPTNGLTTAIKRKLLLVPVLDVLLDNQNSPLQAAAQRTAASLAACFAGNQRQLLYPETL
jgi:CRISPR-associated protein Cas1